MTERGESLSFPLYVTAYIIGGIIGIWLLNILWYPAPANLHGVALGLVMAGASIAGSVVAVIIAAVIACLGEEVPK